MEIWFCDFCREEFDSKLEALEHEKTCSKNIEQAEDDTEWKKQAKERKE